ncbi:MAG TPA: hypothetical protein V6D06_11395 [Trichocoleus sp.]
MKKLFAIGWAVGLGALTIGCRGSQEAASTIAPPDTAPLNADSAAPPAPPPPPQGAFLAQLSPEQTAQLKALGAEVVVPGVVPPTFVVLDIRGTAATGDGADSGAAYSILYRDGGNRCFAIEFASSGIGDMPETEQRLPIAPPLFAGKSYGLNYGLYKDEELRSQYPDPELYTDWLTTPNGAYRLIGASYINATFTDQAPCQDISPAEAKQIVESMTVIEPEVMGDGVVAQ